MEKVNDMSENYTFQENALNFEYYCSLRDSVEWLIFYEEQMKKRSFKQPFPYLCDGGVLSAKRL